MKKHESVETTPANENNIARSSNINQIREVLIGPFQREQDAHFERVEQALKRMSRESMERIESSHDKLQKSLDNAVDKFEARLGELAKNLSAVEEAGKRETARVVDELSNRIKDLDTTFKDELRTLEAAMRKGTDGLRDDVDADIARLRDEKTNRADLGDFLTELGYRLKGEATLHAIDASLLDAVAEGSPAKSQ